MKAFVAALTLGVLSIAAHAQDMPPFAKSVLPMSSARLSKTTSCAVSTLTVQTNKRTGLSRRPLKSTYFSIEVLAGLKS